MVNLGSQEVRDQLLSLLTRFLTQKASFGPSACVWSAFKFTRSIFDLMWLIWTLRKCVICSRTISDLNVANLNSQRVRPLLSNPLV